MCIGCSALDNLSTPYFELSLLALFSFGTP
jgi:hypothetical protein